MTANAFETDTALTTESIRFEVAPETAGGLGALVCDGEQQAVSQPDRREQALAGLERIKQEGRFPFGGNQTVIPCLLELAERLNNSLASYDLVVGEDTSGRLPSLVYWRIVNARRKEIGLPPAAIRFVSGRSEYSLLEHEIPQASTDDARALVVTEFVCSGGSVRNVLHSLRTLRDPSTLDVATLGASPPSPENRPGAHFYSADARRPNVDLFLHFDERIEPLKGVAKFRGPAHSYRPEGVDFTRVRQTREDIQEIAALIYDALPPVTPQVDVAPEPQ